jgi:lysophospholipase L1-like esterase
MLSSLHRCSRLPAWLAILSLGLLAPAAWAEPTWLFVGDSITAGSGATSEERGFVALLGERFPEVAIVNAGCGASSIRDWTNDDSETRCAIANAWSLGAAGVPAQITHIMLGTNDSRGVFEFFGPVPAWEYELRLRLLVERAPGLVLVSAPPPLLRRSPPRDPRSTNVYAATGRRSTPWSRATGSHTPVWMPTH